MPIIDPIAFTVFDVHIYWYGIIIAAAIGLGLWMAAREAKRKNYYKDMVIDIALLIIPLAVVFARIYYVLFQWEWFAEDWSRIYKTWEGGLAIYGAVIGGLVGAVIFCRWKKFKFSEVADILAPSLLLGQIIGRWGNFINQEAFGPKVEEAAWQWFPYAVYIEGNRAWHMATFFYESLWNVGVLIFLLLYRKKERKAGSVFLWYMVLYGVGRFWIEGLRMDSLMLGSLRVSQLLSALIVVFALVMLIVRRRQRAQELVDPEIDEKLSFAAVLDVEDKGEVHAKEESASAVETEETAAEEVDAQAPAVVEDATAASPDEGAPAAAEDGNDKKQDA